MNDFLTALETAEGPAVGSLRGKSFSTKVNVLSGDPVVAEEAIYWQLRRRQLLAQRLGRVRHPAVALVSRGGAHGVAAVPRRGVVALPHTALSPAADRQAGPRLPGRPVHLQESGMVFSRFTLAAALVVLAQLDRPASRRRPGVARGPQLHRRRRLGHGAAARRRLRPCHGVYLTVSGNLTPSAGSCRRTARRWAPSSTCRRRARTTRPRASPTARTCGGFLVVWYDTRVNPNALPGLGPARPLRGRTARRSS